MDVELKGISKHYGSVKAVDQVSLKIKSGALHFFLGPSGCGKTTTLRMLAGLENPTGGQIYFGENDVTNVPASARGIAMVFQNYALWPHMTVRENINYALRLRKVAQKEITQRCDDVIALTQLTGLDARYPGQLSGGQQQRVALARALAVRPHVLLLDEPLSNLDAKLRNEMREYIDKIHRETDITMIYVTHDQNEALSLGSSVSVMKDGKLIQSDTPRQIYHHPHSAFIASFIGETNLLEGKVKKKDSNRLLLSTQAGDIWSETYFKPFEVGQDVVLSMRPEALHVNEADKYGTEYNHFEASVDKITYLGRSDQVAVYAKSKISLAEGAEFTSLRTYTKGAVEAKLNEGDRLDLVIHPKRVTVVDPFGINESH